MSNPEYWETSFETNPNLRAFAEYREPTSTPAPATPTPLAQFQEKTLDDGAKARLKSFPVVDLYKRWFSPTDMKDSGNGNYLTNCFNSSGHSNGDKNPSLCLKSGENVYTCYGCGISGDNLNLSAVHSGLGSVDGSFADSSVHEIVMNSCRELYPDMRDGWVMRNNNWQYDQASAYQRPAMLLADFIAVPDAATPTSSIGPANKHSVNLNWREWVPQNTPLRTYMEIVCEDGNPEEFHFFNFMTLIGLVLGREVCMTDDYPEIYGNLLTCLIGSSGQGKSKTLTHIRALLKQRKLVFDFDNPNTRGVRIISGVGSGEVLVDSLGHSVTSPSVTTANGVTIAGQRVDNPSPRSLVIWSEFSNLIAKTKATGSTMSDKLIDMYDLVDPMSAITRAQRSHAYHPYGSALTTTQSTVIKELVGESDQRSGFLNRWLFIFGTSKEYQPWSNEISIIPVFSQIDNLYTWLDGITRTKFGKLKRTPEATTEASRFLAEIIRPRITNDDTSSMFARMDLVFKKLILLFSANMMEQDISIESVYQAEKAWIYLEFCMLSVIENLQRNSGDNEVLDYIVNKVKTYASRVDSNGQQKFIDKKELNKSVRNKFQIDIESTRRYIENAERLELIELRNISSPSGGRNKIRYVPISEEKS